MSQSPDRSRVDLGKSNRRRVLGEILYKAPIARTEIAERTGLTGASVSRITRDLISAGLVRESTNSQPQNRSGRRLVELTLNPDGGYLAGVGINAFAQWVSISDLNQQVLAKQELAIESFADPQALLQQVVDTLLQMLEQCNIPLDRLLGAGVAMGGAVDPDSGKLLFSTTMDWGEVEVADFFRQQLKVPVQVETLPNALNLAETRFGQAQGCKNVVLINASLKMGASLLLDGQIHRGMNFSAGLIGRLRLQRDQQANQSPMLLDDVAAGVAVLKAATGDENLVSGHRAAATLMQLRQRSLEGDSQISELFRNTGKMLSQTIDLIVTLLQPQMVLLAGPMASVPAYVEGVLENLDHQVIPDSDRAAIQLCRINSEEAGRWLALHHCLLSQDLDLDQLASNQQAR